MGKSAHSGRSKDGEPPEAIYILYEIWYDSPIRFERSADMEIYCCEQIHKNALPRQNDGHTADGTTCPETKRDRLNRRGEEHDVWQT